MPTTPVTPMVPQPRSTPSMNLLSYNTDDSSDSDIIVSDSDPNDDLDENINLETNRNHNTSTSTSSAHTNQIPTHLQPIRHNTAFQQNSAFFNSSSSASSSGFSSPARFDDTSDSINIDSDSDSDQNDSIDIISDNESDSGLNSTDYNSNPASEKYFSNDDDYDGDNDNALVPRIGTSKLTYQPGISSSSSSSHSRSTSSLSSLNSNTINGTAPIFAVAAAASHLDSNSPTINNLATFSLSDRAHQNFGDTSADEDFFSIHNNSNSTTLNLSEIIDQEQNNRFSSPTSSPSDLPLIPSSASNTTLTHLTPSDPDSVSLHRNHAEPSLGSSQYTSGSESGTTGIPADSSSALSFSYASHASKTSPTQSPTLDHDNIFHSDSSQFPSTLLSSTTPSPSLILERPAIFNEGPPSTMTQPDKLPPPPSKRKTSGVLSMAARFEQQESDPSPPPRNFYTGRARKSSISTPFSSLTSNASSRTSSIPGTSIFGEKAEPSQAKSPSLVSPISKRVPISIPSTFTGADSSSTFTPPALKPTSSPFSLRKSVAPLVRSKKEVSDEVPEPSADTELPSTAELENVPESMDSSSDPAQISTKSPILTGIDETEKSRDLVPPVVDATVPHLDTPATTIDPDTVDTPVLNQAAVVAVPSDSLTDLHSPVDSTLPSSSPASVERSPEADAVLELPKNFSPSADSAPTIGSPESTGETPVPLTSSFDNITTSPLVNHLPSQDPSSSVLLSSDEFPSTDIPRSSTESPTHPDSDITSAPLVAPISLSTVETTHQALPVVDSLSPTNSFVSLTDSFVSTVDEINLKSKSAESAEPAQPTSPVSSSSLTHSSPNKASSPLPSSSLPDSLALDPQPASAVSSPSAVPVSSPKSPAEPLSALSSHSPVLESSQAVAPLSPLPKSLSSSLHSESDPISPTGSLWSPQSASQWSATASHFSLSNSHLGEAASPPGSLSSSVFRSLTGLTSMPPSIPVDASLSATVASNSPDSSLESSSSSSSDDENDDIDDIDDEEFQPALDSSSLLRSVPSDEHAPSTILPTTPVVSAEEAPEFVDSVQSPPGTSPSSSLSISSPELAPQIATTTGHIVSAPPADNSPSSASRSAASLKSAAESPLASPQLRASSPVDSPELAASSPVRSSHLATSSPLTAPQIGDSSPITHSQPSASSPVASLRPAEVSPVSSPQIEAPSPVARSGPAASSLLSHTQSSVSLELLSRDSTSPVKESSAASPPSAQRSPSAGQWSPEPLSSPESPPRADAVTPKAEHFSLPSSPSDTVAVPRSPSSSALRSPIGLISAPDSLPPDSFVVTDSFSPIASPASALRSMPTQDQDSSSSLLPAPIFGDSIDHPSSSVRSISSPELAAQVDIKNDTSSPISSPRLDASSTITRSQPSASSPIASLWPAEESSVSSPELDASSSIARSQLSSSSPVASPQLAAESTLSHTQSPVSPESSSRDLHSPVQESFQASPVFPLPTHIAVAPIASSPLVVHSQFSTSSPVASLRSAAESPLASPELSASSPPLNIQLDASSPVPRSEPSAPSPAISPQLAAKSPLASPQLRVSSPVDTSEFAASSPVHSSYLATSSPSTAPHFGEASPVARSLPSASSPATSPQLAARSSLARPLTSTSDWVTGPLSSSESPLASPQLGVSNLSADSRLSESSPPVSPQFSVSSSIAHSQPSASSPITKLQPAEESSGSSPQLKVSSPVSRELPSVSGPIASPRYTASSPVASPQFTAETRLGRLQSPVSSELPSADSKSPIQQPSHAAAVSPPSAQRSPSAGQWSPEPLSSPESPPRADAVTPKAEHFSLPSSPSDTVAVPRSPSSSALRSPTGLISAPDSLPPDSFVVDASLSPAGSDSVGAFRSMPSQEQDSSSSLLPAPIFGDSSDHPSSSVRSISSPELVAQVDIKDDTSSPISSPKLNVSSPITRSQPSASSPVANLHATEVSPVSSAQFDFFSPVSRSLPLATSPNESSHSGASGPTASLQSATSSTAIPQSHVGSPADTTQSAFESPATSPQLATSSPIARSQSSPSPIASLHPAAESPFTSPQLGVSSPLSRSLPLASSPIVSSHSVASSPVVSLKSAASSPSSPQFPNEGPLARSQSSVTSPVTSLQIATEAPIAGLQSPVSLEFLSRDSTSPVKEPSAASPPSAQRSPSAGQWSPEPLSSPESPPRADAVTPKAEHFSLPSSPSDAVAVPRSPSSSVLRSPIGLISAPDSLPPDSFVVTNSLSPHAPVAVEVASRELSPETVQKSHSSVKSLSLNESSPSIITSKAVTDTLISSQIPPSTSLFVSVPNSPEAISEAIPEPSSPLPSEGLLPTALPVSSPVLHSLQSPQSSRDSVHSTVLGEDSEADVETRTFESPVVPASSTTPFSLPESHEIAEGSTASHEAVLPRALDTTVGLAPELPFRSSGEYDASNSLDISPQSPVDSLSSDGSFASASPVAYSHPPTVLPDLSSSEHIHASADDEIEFHSGSYRDDHVDSPRPSSRSPSLDLPESSEVTITTIDTSPPASQHTPVDSSAFGDPVKNDEITVTSPTPASQPSVAPLSLETFSEPALPSPDSPLASVTMSKEEGDPLQSSTRAGPEPESESDSDSSEASFNSAASSPQAPTFALADSTEFATTFSVTPSEQGSDSPTTSHFAEPVIPLAAAASVAAVATAASFSPSISASPELAPVQNPWSSDAVLNPPVVVHSHVASSPSEIASFDFDTPSTVPKTPEHISVPREVSTQTRVTSPSPVSSVSSVVHTPAATDLAPESELRVSTEAVSHSSFSDESLKDDWSNLSRSEIAEIPLDSPEAPAPRSPDDSFVFPAVPAAAALTVIPEMPLSFASGKPLPPSPDDTFTKPLPASPGKFDSVAEQSSGESLSRSLGDSSEYLNIAPAEAGLINPIISQKSLAVPTKPYITSDVEQPHSFSSDVIPVSRRTPSVTLKPIVKEAPPVPQEEEQLIFAVCVVGFHHTHGPQVEYWKGRDGDQSKLWPNLPFQSLPDGSHSHEENFCYFTMLYDEVNRTAPISVPTRDRAGNVIEEVPNMDNVTTLFGISCNRQINSEDLKDRPADVTRSTVHKSVVVIARKPIFGPIREKLAVITRAFFQQGDFRDVSLIDNLYDNLNQLFSVKLDENVLYVGMSLRELIYRLRSNVLVLLKALLLEKKIIFYSKSTEVLCASQFSLISLVPALLDHLEDCSSPLLSKFEHTVKKPTSLRSSDRKSLLAFMGLPLQPFAEGGMFNPYVPLQQFNELKAPETKYFLVGSTNSLLIENCPADIIVQMDQSTVEIKNSKLKNLLSLSASDKKWMDYIVQAVVDTWDPEDPWRPKGLGFHGSEDFVRQQFEDYIMGLMSSVKYDSFLSRFGNSPPKTMLLREVNGNPMKLFNQNWVQEWRSTTNFRIFSKITDNEVFDIVEPRHMVSTLSVNEAHQRSLSLLSHTSQASQDLKDKRSSIPAPARSAKSWGSFWWRGTNDQGKGSAQHTKTNSTDPQSNLEVSSPKSTAPSSLASSSSLQNSPSVKDGDSVVRSSGSPDDDSSFVSKNSRAEANRNRTNTVSTTQSVNLSPVHSRGSSTSSSQRSSTTPSSGIFKGWSLWGGAGSRKSGSLNKSNSTQRLSQQHLPPSGYNPFAATSSVPSSSTDITSQSSDSNTNGSLHNSSRSVSSPVALSRGLSDHHRDPFSPMEAPDSPPISFASARRFGAPSS